MRLGSSGLVVMLATCAANAPPADTVLSEKAGLCPRLAAFGLSVPLGEARSVTLSGEGLLGTQTCERGDPAINPGGAALCRWWVVNSAREFFGENFRDVVDCLTIGTEIDSAGELRYRLSDSGSVLDGQLVLNSVRNIDKGLAVEVVFNAPVGSGTGEPVRGLRVTFRRAAS